MPNRPNEWGVDHKSRKINRTSKTPAQDRLRNVQLLPECIRDSTNNNKVDQLNQRLTVKRKIESPAIPAKQTKRFKAAEPSKSKSECQRIEASRTEIPDIFPLQTPAQNRLLLLQQKPNARTKDEIIEPKVELLQNETENRFLQVFRQAFGIGIDENENIPEGNVGPAEPEKTTQLRTSVNGTIVHIVPDTNVFLRSLACIENHILNDANRYIVVPLVVLEELDCLKRGIDKKIAFLARRAIDFLYNHLKAKVQRVQGQKATDDQKNFVKVKVEDDRVLNCCEQIKQRNQIAILLTNDKNLINKATSYDIVALTTEEYGKNYGK